MGKTPFLSKIQVKRHRIRIPIIVTKWIGK